jgi:Ca-activated chloride channel homolog
MPETLHFVRPEWLAGIPVAILLGLLWARRARRLSRWETRIDPVLLGILLDDHRQGGARGLPWILAAALAAGSLGLAGPSWERLPQPVEQRSDALVIVLDLSLSMFAEDVAPSRLVRARQKIADMLRLRREGFTALVAYAGNAHTVVPLTEDTRTIENLLPALSPAMMPVFGSNLGEAIELAQGLFRNAGLAQGLIVVITDGVDRVADVTERRNRNFPISILGVGTDTGGTIPLDFADQRGQVLRTQQGEPILARLDEAELAGISETTYGRYRTLGIGDDDVNYLLTTPLPGPEETREVDRTFDLWADQGFWLALLLVPLLLLGFRRGVFALLPLLLLPGPADASLWDDLWLRPDQQAYQQLQEGQPERAAALFEDPDWRAAALYRSGEYERAAGAFAERARAAAASPAPKELLGDSPDPAAPAAGSLTPLYNQGNALARQGDYQGAIDRYDAVLTRDPEHADARFNRALLEKLLEAQNDGEPGQDQNDSQSQGDPQNAGGQPEQDPGAELSDQAANEDPDQTEESREQDTEARGQPEDGERREHEAELANRDIDRDALEQWLRRVPDDPGGLLRRKFQYETNQRLRRGEYRARDTEKIW